MQDDHDQPDVELEEIADQLQVGDRAEGAAALRKVIERAQKNGGEAALRQLQGAVTGANVIAETKRAADEFVGNYPILKIDREAAATTYAVTADNLREDLRSAGYQDADIAAAGDDIHQLSSMYDRARIAGAKVRDPRKLMTDVGATIEKDHGIRPGREGEERARNLAWFNETRKARGYGVIDDIGKGPRNASAPPPQRRNPPNVIDRRPIVDAARAARGYAPKP
jgi:hypothetical protein